MRYISRESHEAKSKEPARFRSDEELARFVETHDLADHWDEFEEVAPLELDPRLVRAIDRRAKRKQLISIRLETWQVRLARATATRERIPYHTVIRRWIEQGIGARRVGS